MDWLDELAKEAAEREIKAKDEMEKRDAAIKQLFVKFDDLVMARFHQYAAALKSTGRYSHALARAVTVAGTWYWEICNVGMYSISLKISGGSSRDLNFYLTGYFDAYTERTFGDAYCPADEFSIGWLDQHMEPILRKALL